jgi:hypothetical protein
MRQVLCEWIPASAGMTKRAWAQTQEKGAGLAADALPSPLGTDQKLALIDATATGLAARR